MKTDIEIAQVAKLEKISIIAKKINMTLVEIVKEIKILKKNRIIR